jgi:hypothetical protein
MPHNSNSTLPSSELGDSRVSRKSKHNDPPVSLAFGFAALAFSLAACDGDTQHARYPSISEAKRDHAIERGWLPSVLPESATDIVEFHDLDVNIGSGTFTFSSTDAEQFRSQLRPMQLKEGFRRVAIDRPHYERQGFTFYVFEDFYLAVNWQIYKAHFWLDYRDETKPPKL